MKRINTPTASSGKFVDGNPSIGRKATQISAEWCNNVQEELCNAIKAITGNDPTGAVSMDELGAALAASLFKVSVDIGDNPGHLLVKFPSENYSGAREIYFVVRQTQGGKMLFPVIGNGEVTREKIAPGAVGENELADRSVLSNHVEAGAILGKHLSASVVSAVVTPSAASQTTKTKVADLHSANVSGLVDITVVAAYDGSGFNPSQVSFTIEDGSGNVLSTWDVNGGGAFSGSFSKRMVGKALASGMLVLYMNHPSIVTGWTPTVSIDGLVYA